MIPKQLQKEEFKFCLVKSKSKEPFEMKWQEGRSYNDPVLLEHIKKGGNYGIIGGPGKLRILDIDNKELGEKLIDKFNTLTIKTMGGGYHFYFICEYNTNHVFKDDIGELRAKNYMVVGANCFAIDNKKNHRGLYKIYKDVEIQNISIVMIEDYIRPYLKNEFNYKDVSIGDQSNSGREFKEIMQLIKDGINKEEIYKVMALSSKWATAHEAYKELTYNKALSYVNENKVNKTPVVNDLAVITSKKVSEIINEDIPLPKWRIENLIPESGVTYLAAPPGEGKSLLMNHAAQCIATGKDFFDLKVMKGKVMFFDAENGEICAWNRLKHIAAGNEFKDTDLVDFEYSIFPNIRFDVEHNYYKDFLAFIDVNKPDVIVFDSLVRFMDGSENDAESCKKVFDSLRYLLKHYPHLSIVILHHVTKRNDGGMNALRGSSELAAAASSIIMLKRFDSVYKITIEKSRYVDMSEGFNLFYKIISDEENIMFEKSEGKGIDYDVISLAQDDFWEWVGSNDIETFKTKNCQDILKSKGHSKSTIFKMMGYLIDNSHLVKLSRGFYQIKDKRMTTEEEVKDE